MIQIQQVSKTYGESSSGTITALDNVVLDVEEGTIVALIGPSGSGKSTLLNIIGGIDTPSSGTVLLDGHDISRIGDRSMTILRRELIGIVFQFFNLMPTLSVLENVMLPAELAGARGSEARRRAEELLAEVGMSPRSGHKPNELSGGEMQRTAIARALVNRPKIVIADEPTGNLDSSNGQLVLDLLRTLVQKTGTTMIVATHDPAVAEMADRVVKMTDGKIISDTAAYSNQ